MADSSDLELDDDSNDQQPAPAKIASKTGPNWRRLAVALSFGGLAFVGLLAMALPTRFEDDFRQQKELDALLTLVLFTVLSLAAIAGVRELYPELNESRTFIGLMLVAPLLGFLLLTDRISTISGPGVSVSVTTPLEQVNLTVGQNLVAETRGTPTVEALECPGDQPVPFTIPQQEQAIPNPEDQVLSKEYQVPVGVATEEVQSNLGPTVYWRLTLETCDYDATDLAQQLEIVVATGAFRFIVLVYGSNHFFAYIPASEAVRLFASHADVLVAAINDDPSLLKEDTDTFRSINFNTLSTDDTTLDALTRMRDQNLDTLPLVDDNGDLNGVVTWNSVLTNMMLEIATQTSG
jgi:hypothetical protein